MQYNCQKSSNFQGLSHFSRIFGKNDKIPGFFQVFQELWEPWIQLHGISQEWYESMFIFFLFGSQQFSSQRSGRQVASPL